MIWQVPEIRRRIVAKPKLLFICTANVSRSRTAEDLFKGSEKYEVQSAGIRWHKNGGQVVTQELIDWADKIFVMDEVNDNHLTNLAYNFVLKGKEIMVLGIPDAYVRGDEFLIVILKIKLAHRGVVP